MRQEIVQVQPWQQLPLPRAWDEDTKFTTRIPFSGGDTYFQNRLLGVFPIVTVIMQNMKMERLRTTRDGDGRFET